MSAKQAVIDCLEAAKNDGVVGAPFIVVDDEPFWGADRLDQIESRLAAAG